MKHIRNLVKKGSSHPRKSVKKESFARLEPKIKEKSFDEVGLKHDIPEEYRDSTLELGPSQPDTSINMSEAQDRSEDLINEVDPFTQQPEKVKKVLRISERSL